MFWSTFAGYWPKKSVLKAKNYSKSYFFQHVHSRTNPEVRFLFDGNNFFWSKQWNGTTITEKRPAPQNMLNAAKLSFSCVLKHFCRKYTKKFSLRSEKWLSQNEAKNQPKVIFSQRVRKGANPKEKFWFNGIDIFC